MKDRSRPLVFAALILLVVSLSSFDISFAPPGGMGRQILPWLVVGIIVLFLTRFRCCGDRCGRREDIQDSTQSP